MKKINAVIVLTLTLLLISGCGEEQKTEVTDNSQNISIDTNIVPEAQKQLQQEIQNQMPPQINNNQKIQPGFTQEEIAAKSSDFQKLQEIMNKEPDLKSCDQITDANLNKICKDWVEQQKI